MPKVEVSIVIISLVRNSLYTLVEKLLEQSASFEFEIVVIPHKPFKHALLEHEKVKIFPQEDGKGLAFYRNAGVKKAEGEIIAFIDDDEMPKDDKWLQNLANPILSDENHIVTAGTEIPLKQGYMADSISLLGYPGGAALGFKSLWHVNENDYTNHLCSGNFAIKKSLFKKLGGFDESLKFGAEDVFLSRILEDSGYKIKYVPEATIEHMPRSGLWQFVSWHFRRGRSIAEYSRLKLLSTDQLAKLFKTLFVSVKKSLLTPYLPMVLILWPIQYISQAMGMLYGRIFD